MRSVWNGSIAFGEVDIPVRAYGATEEHGSGLHQLHVNDGGRIRMRRTCEIDGEEVPYAEVGKGFLLPGGDVVVLAEDELADLALPSTHAIAVSSFAPIEQVDPIYFGRSYYLEPDPVAVKAYVLFAEALRQSGRVAIAKVALRQRETLALLRVRDQVIVLATMLWPDEIRTPEFPFLDEDVPVRLREVREATALIEARSGDFAPGRYADGYRAALRELIEAKAQDRAVARPSAVAGAAAAAGLLAVLAQPPTAEAAADEPAKPETRGAQRKSARRSDAMAAAVDDAKAAARRAAAAKAAATRAANRAARASDAARG